VLHSQTSLVPLSHRWHRQKFQAQRTDGRSDETCDRAFSICRQTGKSGLACHELVNRAARAAKTSKPA